MADKLLAVSSGEILDLAGTMGGNNFRGTDSVQYITKDAKVSPSSDFNIENLRCVFIVVKEYINKSKNKFSLSELSKDIKERFNCNFGNIKLKKAMQVFNDVSILTVYYNDEYIHVYEGENFHKKTDITASHTYREQNLQV